VIHFSYTISYDSVKVQELSTHTLNQYARKLENDVLS